MNIQEVVHVRKDDPNRLVHREGKTVTVKTVRETYDSLYRAAASLRAAHFSGTDGWDTRPDWWAYMMLIMSAEHLTGKPTIYIPNDPANLDPENDRKWMPKNGRAEKQQKERTASMLTFAAALQHLPSIA